MNYRIKLVFVTPLFSHGASDVPEVRAPSIRGMLRGWFRLLGGDLVAERRVFGGISQSDSSGHDETRASRIVVRVTNVVFTSARPPALPHKAGYAAAPRNAYAAGTSCEIVIMDRLGGLKPDDAGLLTRAIKAWLMMGTLGFRSTRAAGSFTWEWAEFPYPQTAADYQSACDTVLEDAPVRSALLAEDFSSAEVARRVASDTIGGRDDNNGNDSLHAVHDPLGCIKPHRKTSPLKFRVVQFGGSFRLLAVWDGRDEVTGNNSSDLHDVIDLLVAKHKQIGSLLKASTLY